MARKPEAVYKSGIHKYVPPQVYKAALGGGFVAGIPDMYYESVDGVLWIEWKYYAVLPPTIDLLDQKKSTKLSVLQQQWLIRAHNNGVPVAVICGSKSGGLIYPGLSWQQPMSRDQFKEQAMNRKDIALWIQQQVN